MIKRKKTAEDDSTAVKIAEIKQPNAENIIYTDYQLESGESYTYFVYSFDAFGNRCQVPAAVEHQVPVGGYESNRKYTKIISEGKPVEMGALLGVAADENTHVMMTDGISGQRIVDWSVDRGGWRGFRAGTGNGSYELTVSGLAGETYGYVYLSCLHQPSIGVYLPSQIDVYLGDSQVPITTTYPRQDYHVDREGNVFVGMNLKGVQSSEKIRIRITQNTEWTMISEISVYGAKQTGFTNADAINLVKGKPVILKSCEVGTVGGSFGFMNTDGFQTYAATVDDNRPSISYYMDATQTQMAGLQGVGNSYQLMVDLGGEKAVHMVESRWIQDENLGIYMPDKVTYYGVAAGTGQLEKIGDVKCSSKPQLDWTLSPDENQNRIAKETEFKAVTGGGSHTYTQIVIEVSPKYTNGWTFFNNIAVY